jgi:hypothetical protein
MNGIEQFYIDPDKLEERVEVYTDELVGKNPRSKVSPNTPKKVYSAKRGSSTAVTAVFLTKKKQMAEH